METNTSEFDCVFETRDLKLKLFQSNSYFFLFSNNVFLVIPKISAAFDFFPRV